MHLLAALLLAVQSVSVGDTMTISVDSTIELDIVIRDGKGETTRNLLLVRSEEFAQEVLEVAGGAPRVVRIRCVSSTLERSGTGIPLDKQPTALAGLTFTATRRAKGWDVVDSAKRAAPAAGKALGSWNEISRLLPADGLSAGKEWTVQGDDVRALIFPSAVKESVGELECICESLEDGQASILMKGHLQGKGTDGSTINVLVGAARLLYDVTRKRPLSLNITGGVVSSLDIVDEYREANSNEVQERKVGEINVKSRRMEAVFTFK